MIERRCTSEYIAKKVFINVRTDLSDLFAPSMPAHRVIERSDDLSEVLLMEIRKFCASATMVSAIRRSR